MRFQRFSFSLAAQKHCAKADPRSLFDEGRIRRGGSPLPLLLFVKAEARGSPPPH